ncbi:MAG TPA: tRNA pseudouridine(55) synthase TruB [Candidatus Binatia bacterium]|nr:tRNA pseudouridine(55) synthase TruB [Candidatus Binatia bacterium]
MTDSGLLLVDKPAGPSSAQVVHRIKQHLGAKRVGHLGTLDPFASGLLLLGIKEGTKIADLFLHASKSYRGIMVLGVETDSQDATGKILQVRGVPSFGDSELRNLEQQFFGDLHQVPPMFSALKRHGVPLYRLARQGKEVPREPRAIRIEKLRLNRLTGAEIELELTCSRGTYVRTLVSDMGKVLGCGAHLKSLRRLACGHLHVDQAVTLDEVERLNSTDVCLLALEKALEPLQTIVWDKHLVSRLRLGQQEILRHLDKPIGNEKLARILDPRGGLAALVQWVDDVPTGRWRLSRTFKCNI